MSVVVDENPDVLVIGRGAAGAMAAAAARRAGRTVLVVGKPAGATSTSSGAFDIADAWRHKTPGREVDPFDSGPTWREAMEHLVNERPRHPYARIGPRGRARMTDALALFDALMGELRFASRDDEQNLVLATQLGTVKRSARAQIAHGVDLGAPSLDAATIAVVELDCLGGFDAIPVAATLRWVGQLSRRSFAVTTLRVPASKAQGCAEGPLALARALDDPDAALAFIESVTLAATSQGRAFTHLLLPPVLGFARHAHLVDGLRARLPGVVVGSVLALMPSVPGRRLSDALDAGLIALGAAVVDGRILEPALEGGQVVSVVAKTPRGETRIRPKAVCLASGRFLGGGIERDGGAREVVFGLPVTSGGIKITDAFVGDLLGRGPDDEHAVFRAGIAYDAHLRPLGEQGKLLADNVFAAGSVLEGYDPARDGSGLGVAVLTGLLAGERAAQVSMGTPSPRS